MGKVDSGYATIDYLGDLVSPGRERRSFRTELGHTADVEDPESLFGDLNGRAPHVQHLWIHQGDLLRSYTNQHEQASDHAFELPTGTGKTLVGLLIGEYRRRRYQERVVYLCPTRQLAHQAALQAAEYGVPARASLPPDYEGFDAYQLNEAIAVTTYAALFNVRPRFDSPQVIVLDDAHSSEQYIASPWTMQIDKSRHEQAFTQLLMQLRSQIPTSLHPDSPHSSQDARGSLHMVPTPDIADNIDELTDILDRTLPERSDPWFAWRQLRNHLDSCGFYLDAHTIEVRPYIPPSMTHDPFAQANQRLYMSATLGAAGELERITGVRKIERLPLPESGKRRISQGRRLFLFPHLSLDEEEANSLTIDRMSDAGRSLVLTGTTRKATAIARELEERGLPVLRARDIEQSLEPFAEDAGVLVLANRYDGLDLPGDLCRLLVFDDVPIGAGLLERFLIYRVGASDLMRDRLRTRFEQGVGRCTRSSTDYAAVVIRGQRLTDFCLRNEVRASLSPEIQAEMKFGIENSRNMEEDDFSDLLGLFFEQGDDWQTAVQAIEGLRESAEVRPDVVANRLQDVVADEVDFVYRLWARDYESAITKAVQVADYLGGSETAAYRAWWYYQAGAAAWLFGLDDDNAERIAQGRAFFKRAASARFTTWLAPLSRGSVRIDSAIDDHVDDVHAAELVIDLIEGYGYSGPRFDNMLTRMQSLLENTESSPFEQGIKILGECLGLTAQRPDDVADPDGIWIGHSEHVFLFEAKSEESPGDAVSVSTVRQARTHPDWAHERADIPDGARIINIVVTPRTVIAPEAARSAEGLCHATLSFVQDLAAQVLSTLSVIRANAASVQRDAAVALALDHLRASKLTPTLLRERFEERSLDSLPQRG